MRQFLSLLPCLLLLCTSHQIASAQQTIVFDYGISEVRVFESTASTRQQVIDGFERFLYDIGPEPQFVFEIDVKQMLGGSKDALRSVLHVERYMLLAGKGSPAYPTLGDHTVNQDTAWVYHGPVPLDFTRVAQNDVVTFTSSPHQLLFLNPDAPITFARPTDFTILGFAYRFLLKPAKPNHEDINPADNAYPVMFMKP